MRYDDEFLIIGALLQEPNLWANNTINNSVIFTDNDFEVKMSKGKRNKEKGKKRTKRATKGTKRTMKKKLRKGKDQDRKRTKGEPLANNTINNRVIFTDNDFAVKGRKNEQEKKETKKKERKRRKKNEKRATKGIPRG